MAIGGVEGRIFLLDPHAYTVSNYTKSNCSELLELFFYEKKQQKRTERQLISVSVDRRIILWDAERLEQLHVIRDKVKDNMQQMKSACFSRKNARLLTGCYYLKHWEIVTDSKAELDSKQAEVFSKELMRHQTTSFLAKRQRTVTQERVEFRVTQDEPLVGETLATLKSANLAEEFEDEETHKEFMAGFEESLNDQR